CQSIPPRAVQFGEHIIQYQYRVTRRGLAPQYLSGCQFQCQGKRPRFSMTRIAPRGHPVQVEHQVIPVRPDERDAPVEFTAAKPLECGTKCCRGLLHLTHSRPITVHTVTVDLRMIGQYRQLIAECRVMVLPRYCLI